MQKTGDMGTPENAKAPSIVFLMPVFEDRDSVSALMADLARSSGVERPYCVLVEDGSVRNPVQASDIAAAGATGAVVHLVRNMGHQRAIATGLTYIAERLPEATAVVMDADGEDRADSVPALLAALGEQDVDAVVAQRRRRSEPLGFRIFYILYRLFFQLVTGRSIRFGNFCAIGPQAVRRLACMPELWLHVASSLIVSRMRIGSVPTDRGKRYFGESKMNFVSLCLHGLRSMMVFAEDVMVRVVVFCALLAVGSSTLLALSAMLKLAGIATPGWYSTASGILVVILLQAGILTFVMLMVTGAARSGVPVVMVPVDRLIARVDFADGASPPAATGSDRSLPPAFAGTDPSGRR